MKLLSLVGAALCLGACASQGPYVDKHWSEHSVGPSLSRAFLSYNPELESSYRDFAWKKKQSLNLTIRRHLLNDNPENPFQPYDARLYGPRPNHSLVPHPEHYIHYEGLVFGGLMVAAGGVFIPVPIDSVIGTFEPGGGREFEAGVNEFTRPVGSVMTSFMHSDLEQNDMDQTEIQVERP